MKFWTKSEYLQFAEAMMDKPVSYYAFEMLYWCGLRLGEMLALTPEDFDFEKKTVRINKSYQRIKKKDIMYIDISLIFFCHSSSFNFVQNLWISQGD